jgi:hypothetical protein
MDGDAKVRGWLHGSSTYGSSMYCSSMYGSSMYCSGTAVICTVAVRQ